MLRCRIIFKGLGSLLSWMFVSLRCCSFALTDALTSDKWCVTADEWQDAQIYEPWDDDTIVSVSCGCLGCGPPLRLDTEWWPVRLADDTGGTFIKRLGEFSSWFWFRFKDHLDLCRDKCAFKHGSLVSFTFTVFSLISADRRWLLSSAWMFQVKLLFKGTKLKM